MVQPAHLVDQRHLPRFAEAHVHDVPLGGRDHHTLDPRLALKRPGVRRDELHPRAGERQVQRARVRHVREVEAHHFPATHRQPIPGLTVHEKQVAEPTHQRVGRCFLPPRNQAGIADQQVLQHQKLFAIGGNLRAGLPHENVAVQAERLLDVLANVRMVPVNTSVREPQFVGERVADPGDAVERVVQPDAMPMNARRVRQVIREPHHDFRATRDFDPWSWILPVVAVHRVRLAIDRAVDELGIEIDDVAVLETKHLVRFGIGQGRIRHGKKGRHRRPQRHLRRQHREPGRRRHHGPAGRLVLAMIHRVPSRPRGPQGEFEQIRRVWPRARRLPAQNHAAV